MAGTGKTCQVRRVTANLADYHMHTTLCHHAEGSPIDYVEQAHRVGLSEMGFACHSPMATDFDDWRMRREELPAYLSMVEAARRHGEQLGVTVRLGLEVDFLPGHESWIEELSGMADWDYLIGSVHYLTDSLVVDHPDHLSQLRDLPEEEVWERYWDLFIEAAATGFFDLMAHPDLPKKFGMARPEDFISGYQLAVSVLRQMGVAYEINTAGWHKPIAEAYPALEFLQLGREAHLPLVISSDAHKPEDVGRDFARAADLAKLAGYQETARFEKRQVHLVPIDS